MNQTILNIDTIAILNVRKILLEQISAESLLDQFQITKLIDLSLGSFDISLTNSSLIAIIGILLFSFNYNALLVGNSISVSEPKALAESYYIFLLNLVRDNIGEKGLFAFTFIFTLFSFILILNLLGLIPYVFAVTSHISMTFTLSLSIFLGVTILGFKLHKLNFLSLFFPEKSPMWLAPLLVFIELLSYTARALSLGIRLCANVAAGHLLLGILAGFALTMLSTASIPILIGGSLDVLIVFLFTILELAIAFIQAFVFTLLTCIYISDSVNLH